ncbi:SpvB/TcaC N-terminal domain-containing protein [Eionea flava]
MLVSFFGTPASRSRSAAIMSFTKKAMTFSLMVCGLFAIHSSASAKDRLLRGEQLGPDSILESSNCRYRLHMQLDGNLVLRNQHNTPLFDTKTAGQGRSYFEFQSSDRNLVIYRSNGSGASWAPSPSIAHNTGTQLILQEDGNLVLRRADNSVVWASNTGQPSSVPTSSICSVTPPPPPPAPEPEPDPEPKPAAFVSAAGRSQMSPGEGLHTHQYLASPNCRYRFVMQDDGNAVVYNMVAEFPEPLYDIGRAGQGPSYFWFQQSDNNLAVYKNETLDATWGADVYDQGGQVLGMQDDGNVVLYRGSDVLWETYTSQGSDQPSVCGLPHFGWVAQDDSDTSDGGVGDYSGNAYSDFVDFSGASDYSSFSGYDDLASDVGVLPGEFSVSGGQASYSVPISVASGRGGMQPDLSIHYSGGGNGVLGVGWSLGGLSSIHRCAATLDTDGFIASGLSFSDKDRYCLDGQRLIAVNGVDGGIGTEYKTEIDGYARIQSHGGSVNEPYYWTVKTKAGQVMTYGQDGNARVVIPQKGTLSWAVRRINDSTGKNPVTYHYKGAQDFENVQYIDKITYTGGKVTFDYEGREDISRRYILGHEQVNRYRLHAVNVFVNEMALSRYLPQYAYEGFNRYTTLRSLKQCNGVGECLPALRFEWQTAQEGWAEVPAYRLPYQTTIDKETDMGSRFVDLNGDGLMDYLYYRDVDGVRNKAAFINQGDQAPDTGVSSRWLYDADYEPKHPIAQNRVADIGVRFIDIDGNGLLDQIYRRYMDGGHQQKGAYLNKGDGWVENNAYGPAYHLSADDDEWGDLGSRFVDLNGDGLVDQIYSYLNSDLETRSDAFFNNGNGWDVAPQYRLPEHHIATDSNNTDLGVRFIDVNGDGLVDYVYHRLQYDGQVQKGAYLNNGNGWTHAPHYAPPYYTAMDDKGDIESSRDDRHDSGARFVDVNGDGLVDQIYHRLERHIHREKIDSQPGEPPRFVYHETFSEVSGAYLNTGVGWITSDAITAQYTPRQPIAKDGKTDLGSRFVDVNGDGLLDHVFHRLVHFDHADSVIEKGAYLNTGHGWKRNDAYTPAFHISGDEHSWGYDKAGDKNTSGGSYGSQFIDINGDGLVDQVVFRSIFHDGGHVEHQQFSFINQTQRKHVLTKIVDSTRLETALEYKYLTDKSVYTAHIGSQYPVYDMAGPIPVVSAVVTDNGVGGKTRVNYHYEGLRAHLRGRGSYGYKTITQHYPDTGKSIETIFDHTAFPLAGNIERVIERYNGQTLNDARTVLSARQTAPSVYQVSLDHSIESSYELDGQKIATVTTVHEAIDPYGNIGKLTVHTSGADGQTFSKQTVSDYINDTSRWYLGRLTQSTVAHVAPGQDNQYRRSRFEYDTHTGLLTKESIVSVEDNTPLTTTIYTYDSYGHQTGVRVTASGQSDRYSSTTYDALGRVVKTCNQLNQCSTNTYSPESRLLSTTGLNGLTTTFEYDDFGRKVKTTGADGLWSIATTRFASSGECGLLVEHAYTCAIAQTQGTPPVIAQQDRLGRTVRTITTGFDGRLIYSDTEYNHLAQTHRVSRQYFMGDHVYWAESEYDVLDRVTRVNEPGPHGARTMAKTVYNGLATTVISGDDDREKTVRTNAIGQTIYREEEEGSYVEYTYTADGNLKTTTVAGDTDTTITLYYDEFGRKIKMDDPDMGSWTYQYNAFSELVSQTDAKYQTTTMRYDEVGRMIERIDADGGVTTWHYGDNTAPAGSIGKLIRDKKIHPTEGSIERMYAYDSLGRPDETITLIDEGLATEQSFSTQLAYDSLGRLSHTLYPGSDNFYTENVYNTDGFLAKVRGLRSNSEHYDLDRLLPLIDTATEQASDFLASAARLRGIGEAYQWRINDLQSLTAGGNYGNVLLDHESALTAIVDKSEASTTKVTATVFMAKSDMPLFYNGIVIPLHAITPVEKTTTSVALNTSLREHIGHTIIELETVRDLIAQQAGTYEASAEQLIVLAEQTLAAADNHFQYARTLNRGGEAYTELVNDDQYTTYWQALDVDAAGRTRAEVYGNGIVNDYTYNQATGELQQIHSGLLSISPIRHLEYQYDSYRNVTHRHDYVNDIQEDFTYDQLDRLTRTDIASSLYVSTEFNGSQTQEYDVYGNITYKSDVGYYTYGNGIDNSSGAGIHAVIATTPTDGGSAGNAGAVTTYQYDANGNMVSDNGRTLAWSSFNKPILMTQDGRSAAFSYGSDRSRYKKVNHQGDTTLYIGRLYERVTKGSDSSVDEKHYIYAGGSLVAEHIVSTTAGVQTRYLHKDAQGTIDLVTDAYANVVDRRSFDAWGKLRNLTWKDHEGINSPLYLTQLPFTNKGYTGHETIQEVELIHMNGRVYDATLARFTTADPHIQEGALTQSYNRYSYVMNNPMKYTDPSGYFFKKMVGGFRQFWQNTVGAALREIAKVPALNALVTAAACSNPLSCIAYSAASAYAVTGEFTQAIKAGVIAAATITMSSHIGNTAQGSFGAWLGERSVSVGSKTIEVGRAFAHATVRGTMSVIQGGKFGAGFASAFFSKVISSPIEGFASHFGVVRDVVGASLAGIAGGTIESLGGGKFANGAATAAIQYLYNQVSGPHDTDKLHNPFTIDNLLKNSSITASIGVGFFKANILQFVFFPTDILASYFFWGEGYGFGGRLSLTVDQVVSMEGEFHDNQVLTKTGGGGGKGIAAYAAILATDTGKAEAISLGAGAGIGVFYVSGRKLTLNTIANFASKPVPLEMRPTNNPHPPLSKSEIRVKTEHLLGYK